MTDQEATHLCQRAACPDSAQMLTCAPGDFTDAQWKARPIGFCGELYNPRTGAIVGTLPDGRRLIIARDGATS